MNVTLEPAVKGTVRLTIEVSVDETKPHLDHAVQRLGASLTIPGFRPGKAPSAMVIARVGDMAVYEEAANDIVASSLYAALKEKNIDSIGRPDIAIEKMAPGNPIVFRATVSVVPKVELGDWRAVKVKKQPVTVTDVDVSKVIDDFCDMQATETLAEREARLGDKAEIDFEVKRDGAVIEGGTGKKFAFIIGRQAMIPGFEEQLIGERAGAKKEFTLAFPKPYVQEQLAGKEAQFTVTLLSVYERVLPEKNDEWARRMLDKSYNELESLLRENLMSEREAQERERIEQEIVQKIIEQGAFGDIPDSMVAAEVATMVHEVKDDVAARRMQWDRYLHSLKKTQEQFEEELKPHAERRIKGALALRALANELQTVVSDDEIEHELAHQRERYHDDAQALKSLERPEARDYCRRIIMNRKTIDQLVTQLSE